MPAAPSYRSSAMKRSLQVNADLQIANNPQLLRIFRPVPTKGENLKPSTPIYMSPEGETIAGYLVEEVFGRITRTRRAYRGLETVSMDQSVLSELEWVIFLPAGCPIRHKDFVASIDGQRFEVIIVTPKSIYPHRVMVVARLAQ